MTVLRNNATQTFGEMNKSLGITAGLSNAIIFLSENMKALAVVLAVAGAALLVAFGPALLGMLSAATAAVWTFTAALAANPIGLLVVGITAATAAIAVFGDEIAVTADKSVTLKDMFRTAFAYISDAAGVAAEWIKSVWNTAIDWVNSKTEGWGEQFRDVGNVIVKLMKGYVNFVIASWVGAFNAIKVIWDKFPDVMQYVFASVVNFGASAVETVVNAWQVGLRKIAELGAKVAPDMAGRLNAAVNAATIKLPRMQVGDAAKGAAAEVGKAFTDAFNKDYVGDAANAVMARARDIAAKRKAAEGQRSALRGTGPNLRGTGPNLTPNAIDEKAANAAEKIKAIQEAKDIQQAYDRIYEEAVGPQRDYNANLTAAQKLLSQGAISQDQYNRAVTKASEAFANAQDPLRQYNKDLQQQQTLLGMLPKQREVEQQIMQIGNDLLQKGIVLTQAETAALREKLTVIQQLNAVSQQEAALMDASVTKRQAFIDQLTAIKNLRANQSSGFTAGDQANATNSMLKGMGVDTTNFQSNIDAQLAMYQTYNDRIKAMYDQRLITEQEYASASMQIELQRQNVHLNAANSFFGNLAALQKSGNKKMAAVGKAAAIAQAMISTYQSATSAYAAMASIPYVGPALGAAAAAAAIAAGLANVQQIRSQNAGFKEGGYTGSIGVNEVAGVVHGREYVMDANATARIGVANLQALQAGAAGVQRNGEQAGAASVGSAPAAAPAPIVTTSFNAVVVQSKEAALAGLKSSEGQAFIIETIEQNGSTVAKIVGVK